MFQTDQQIAEYLKKGRRTLNEAESKKLLASFGVPVTTEFTTTSPDEATSRAEELGFPVVLKGLGIRLTHKTEKDLVRVNLSSSEEVRSNFASIKAGAGDHWEGCLVQPMIAGHREFMAGLFRDPQFGPVIMFGLGGIFAEAIGDVAFRIAPVNPGQALEMAEELSSGKLLHGFRGLAPADREQLAAVLTGLCRLGLQHPEIREVDINPLIVSDDGTVTAVDSLVVIEDPVDPSRETQESEQEGKERRAEIRKALETMTHPRSIAVVGATRTPVGGYPGMFACIRNFGFAGSLYPINPNADEIDGIKAYPSLCDLPESVDLVIISVPGQVVPDALKDCIASGNKNIHIFSSGFRETGEPEGIRLQEEIAQIASEGGLHVVGPNCMGFYVPESRLMTWRDAARQSGPLAFISQSGGHAQDFTCYAAGRLGLYFSKVISYGNALTLDAPDFLDYLGEDEKTEIIAMYMEGVKNGRRLLELAASINLKKPVLMFKGGLTESGARAVASHTGAMAGGEKIWKAFFRQTGIVPADSLEQIAEIALALHHLDPWTGRNVVILGTGGGIGVAAADACAKAGLQLPALSKEIMTRLRKYIPPAGTMIRNPIDAHMLFLKPELLGSTLEMLALEPDLDMFVISLHFDWIYGRKDGTHAEEIGRYIAGEARRYTGGKPLAVVWRQYQPDPDIKNCRIRVEKMLLDAGIPVYEGLDRALTALSRTAAYHEFKRGAGSTAAHP
ncbi:MAG: acetate--CoA ligase family protein [Desulfobacteraceae bacterium]|nr:acetate--CoA ligase family protein [Desulfobacteraceae bacterium]